MAAMDSTSALGNAANNAARVAPKVPATQLKKPHQSAAV